MYVVLSGVPNSSFLFHICSAWLKSEDLCSYDNHLEEYSKQVILPKNYMKFLDLESWNFP